METKNLEERAQVRIVRTTAEKIYLVAVAFISFLIWIYIFFPLFETVAFFIEMQGNIMVIGKAVETLTTPLVIITLFLFFLFSHLLALAFIRMNGIKVSPNQFSELWEALQILSKRLGMKKQPDMFVINGQGILNAFATKLIFRKLLVVYSDLAEALIEGKDQKQLEAVLSHELGHHALNHTGFLEWFLMPGKSVPFLGTALSRTREYSADKIMKALIPNNEACSRALVKLAAGKTFGEKTNIDAYKKQAYEEAGFFSWFSELLSTHPHLPKRIIAISS